MRIDSLIFIVTILLLFSCKTKDNICEVQKEDCEVIDSYYLADIVNSWDAVYLDDSSIDCLTGVIKKVCCDDSLIFVSHVPNSRSDDSEQSIYAFNRRGNFICRIGRLGRAFNEYQGCRSWTVDKYRKEIVIFDMWRKKLLRYGYDGRFIKSQEIQDDYKGGGQDLFVLKNGDLILQQLLNPKASDDYLKIHTDGSIKSLFEKRDINTEDFIIKKLDHFASLSNEIMYKIRPFDNILYTITDDKTSIVSSLGFLPSYSKKELKMITMEDGELLAKGLLTYYDTQDYLILSLFDSSIYLYKKKSNQWFYYPNLSYSSDIIVPNNFIGVDCNTLIGFIDSNKAELELQYYSAEMDKKQLDVYRNAAKNENATLLFLHVEK